MDKNKSIVKYAKNMPEINLKKSHRKKRGMAAGLVSISKQYQPVVLFFGPTVPHLYNTSLGLFLP